MVHKAKTNFRGLCVFGFALYFQRLCYFCICFGFLQHVFSFDSIVVFVLDFHCVCVLASFLKLQHMSLNGNVLGLCNAFALVTHPTKCFRNDNQQQFISMAKKHTVIIPKVEKPVNEVRTAGEMLSHVVEPVCVNLCD